MQEIPQNKGQKYKIMKAKLETGEYGHVELCEK